MGEQDKNTAIFAKQGFTEGCIHYAMELGNVTLITYKDMMKK